MKCGSTESSGSSVIDVTGESSRPHFLDYLIVPKVDWRGIDVTGELPQPLFIGYVIVQQADMDL